MESFRTKNKTKKQPSLPKNWPNPSEEDLAANPLRVISLARPQEYSFKSNFVKTSKYEIWNFLPLFLFEEFNPKYKVANCYFLLISCLQSIPTISNTNGIPTFLLPLTFVVMVDAIFQIIEDYHRHKADAFANSSVANKYCFDTNELVKVPWSELCVGDFVKIFSREPVPADILVLGVHEKADPPQGICYVETKSLDGETNLKLRQALPATTPLARRDSFVKNLGGKIEMEHPNKLIDSFTGVIELNEFGRESILPGNIILRGCVVRNTDWVIGCILNTGHDTKIMMSAAKTPSKSSNIESMSSLEVLRMMAMLAFICVIGSLGSVIWSAVNDYYNVWYNYYGHEDIADPNDSRVNPFFEFIIKFFYFFLLHATFIPVSLYVSMTLARFFQSYFMIQDIEMYYEKTDRPAEVRTMTLNEELGQISHIFSDKTGTLTCNVMDFRKMSVNGKSYGLGITEIGKASWKLQGKNIPPDVMEGEERAKAASVDHVSFYDEAYQRDLSAGGLQKERIQQFFRVLSVCHDVIPERIDGKIKLSASNPDDEALVCAAKYFGFEFKDRHLKTAIVANHESGQNEEIEVLCTIGFTSKRKRMSVIVKHKDGKIQMLIKGADAAIAPRLAPGQDELFAQTDDHMRQYSVEGLRCLLVAFKDVDENSFHKWHNKYERVATDLDELDKRKKGEENLIEKAEEEIEQGFTLIGCTAIEDKLQDGVPECIACLAKAGLNIWILTGDKEETAINIAVACNLVLPKAYMKQIIINNRICPNAQSMKELMQSEMKACQEEIAEHGKLTLPRALIIDGASLIVVMGEEGIKDVLLEFSQMCQAVVGCRVSPDQKREMVHLIKFGVPGVRTLSIGDGANDVAMIQEAHIGVGIRGEEGLQAVNASDYAIAQFKFLQPLLLKHGRNNYRRMSHLVIYMFYKNVMMSICQFWFAWFNGFSGQKLYTEAAVQFFNLMYTSIPIIIIAVYDYDLPSSVVYQYPQLYQEGVRNENFNVKLFWLNILNGIVESVLLAIVPLYALDNTLQGGVLDTFWQAGALTYTAVIFVVNIRVGFITERWYFFHLFLILASIAVWFFTASVVSLSNNQYVDDNLAYYGMWHRLLRADTFWLTLCFLVVTITVKNSAFSLWRNIFVPTNSRILLEQLHYCKTSETAVENDELKKISGESFYESNPSVEMMNGNGEHPKSRDYVKRYDEDDMVAF